MRRLPGIGAAVDRLRFVLRKGRRVRRQWRDGGPARRYTRWVHVMDTPSAAELTGLQVRAAQLGSAPVISVILFPEPRDASLLDRAVVSIRAQVYQAWEVCLVLPGESAAVGAAVRRHAAEDPRIRLVPGGTCPAAAAARNIGLAAATGQFVTVIDGTDVLPAQALLGIAEAIERHPDAALIYADEDRIDARGNRHDPWFKCDCNRELLLTHDAISRPAVYDRGVVHEIGGWRENVSGAEDHDLALRVVEAVGPRRVVHVPRILCHRGSPVHGGAMAADESGRRAVWDLLQSRGRDAVVEAAPEAPGRHRVRYPLPATPPLVSIMICTRDHERLLSLAIESITSRTTYPRYEIVIVDNGSVEPRAIACLARLAGRPDVRVLRDDGPFNYARLNNRAAASARGEVLCLLNDDVEVLTPGWLEELVSFAVQPDVGAVGARLWYPDGTLQHGGVILGIGRDVGHAHPRISRGDPGYHGRAVLQQELSAVTAACLAVRAELFAAVAGLDERLGVAFNDVDFCLRLGQAGYRTVWTPYAELVHHESASRGVDDTPAKRARAEREAELLHGRWGESLRRDPFYNPNLSHAAADFSVDAPAGARGEAR